MLRARRAAGLILLAALLTTIPYIVATILAQPGTQFSGFLLNPLDGFSYLAKMRQGALQLFEFRLPYASEPGPGSMLFVFHLALGRLAELTGVAPLVTYHTVRLCGSLAMYASAWALFSRALGSQPARQAALVLAAFGSGVGWLGTPFGLLPIDLWVPEAIPFLSAYANAHFPIASAIMISAITLIAFDDFFPRLRIMLSFGAGLGLALIQPFSVLPVLAASALWSGWEAIREGELRPQTRSLSALLAFAFGSAPVLAYDLLSTRLHPVLAVWAGQNVTPTPGLLETGLGYGIVLLLAALGAFAARRSGGRGLRLLVWWAAVGLLLLSTPVALQRRMMLGLYFPLAGLAGAALARVVEQARRRSAALLAIVALSIPSHLIVVAAGLSSVASGSPELVLSEGERQSYRWIEANLAAETVVLTGPRSGNRLPAYSDARVLYGHPFETPQAQQARRTVERLYGWSGGAAEGLRELDRLGIEYVLYGTEERELGSPRWLSALEPVVKNPSFAVYRVARP